MVLVYTDKITPRLSYIFKHIFIRILNTPVSFTTKTAELIAYDGLKICYSKAAIGDAFFIRCHDLLFEQGINDTEIFIQKWTDDIPCFFHTGKAASIPYDIFAASFYLLSRYEEYLPHVQDRHERFPAEESLAFKNGFLEKPLVDIWAYKLLDVLKASFPMHTFTSRTYKYISTFDISQAYMYKYQGFIRTIGGFVNDFFKLRLNSFWDRMMVLFKIRKDPYDTYDEIVYLKKKHKIEISLFFLIANFTTFDNNISITKNKFRLLIKSMSDYMSIGLNASYFTMNNAEILKKETKKMASVINMPVSRSRQHLTRMHLPETYQNLVDLEVQEDYTMGYSDCLGFRASTCTPFYFYDLDFEIQTPLKVVPFAVSDYVLHKTLNVSVRQALLKVSELQEQVKAVEGTFVTLFHNELLSNYGTWNGWKHFYEEVLFLAKEQV